MNNNVLYNQTKRRINDIKNNITTIESDISDLNTSLSNIGDASPAGVYATVGALETAFPTGDDSIYVVSADGKWYYWNGSTWTDGGTYQATEIADGSVTQEKIADNAITIRKIGKSVKGFIPSNFEQGRLSATTGGTTTAQSDEYLRSKDFMYSDTSLSLNFVGAVNPKRVRVFYYSLADKTFISHSDFLESVTIEQGFYYKLVFSYAPLSTVSISEIKDFLEDLNGANQGITEERLQDESVTLEKLSSELQSAFINEGEVW